MHALTREPGGTWPGLGELFEETLADFTRDPKGHLLLGLAVWLVAFVAGFVLGVVASMVSMVLSVVGMAAGIFVAQASDAAPLAFVLVLGILLVAVALTFLSVLVLVVLLAPVTASAVRALAAYQRGEAALGFEESLATVRQDLVAVMGVTLATTAAGLLGMVVCYVGALVPATLFLFASYRVMLARERPLEAMRASARAAMERPGAHFLLAVTITVVTIVAAYVPVLGTAFALSFVVRAYRKVHGDGGDPGSVA